MYNINEACFGISCWRMRARQKNKRFIAPCIATDISYFFRDLFSPRKKCRCFAIVISTLSTLANSSCSSREGALVSRVFRRENGEHFPQHFLPFRRWEGRKKNALKVVQLTQTRNCFGALGRIFSDFGCLVALR